MEKEEKEEFIIKRGINYTTDTLDLSLLLLFKIDGTSIYNIKHRY